MHASRGKLPCSSRSSGIVEGRIYSVQSAFNRAHSRLYSRCRHVGMAGFIMLVLLQPVLARLSSPPSQRIATAPGFQVVRLKCEVSRGTMLFQETFGAAAMLRTLAASCVSNSDNVFKCLRCERGSNLASTAVCGLGATPWLSVEFHTAYRAAHIQPVRNT
jgi:hypothetical protein